jgi:L-ascorbate metabolism protein UlaG (beta-lactamase superfamily)
MKLTHLGHACLLVETDGARLLFDPGTMSAFDDVRDLDGVLVTHQHPDHLDPVRIGSLLAANPRAALWVDADTVAAVPGLPAHRVVRAGDKFGAGGWAAGRGAHPRGRDH